ncbi:hypothetical protein [Pseudomonas sp. Marseille-Q5115]|uniref:hypothetical protein n=1 Tax=Pseudomonas sp. Marseille-Q5115 TaxID=2866593 RepID=UPI001CE3DDF1|nr:hypothetical protein [Pseudomonas sp. Marseille-Q5115]
MKGSEPVAILDKSKMDVLERVAQNAGTTGENLIKEIFKKVLDALEEAHMANDPVHGSFATNVFPLIPKPKKSVPD